MKEIIIKRNRNYFRPILSSIIILFSLYFLIFKFLLYPSEHTYFLLKTKEIVVIFSIVGIIFCFLGLYLIIKIFFIRNPFLKVDKHGIYDGFSIYNRKFFKWEEIERIETFRQNYNNYIALFLEKDSNKEKGINYVLYKMNEIFIGTPYIISSGYLECSFKELEKVILEAFKKNEKRKRYN